MNAFNNFNTPNINNEYEENYLAQSEFKEITKIILLI